MSITKQQWFDMGDRAWKCALRFLQDAGYADCHVTTGRHDWGELTYEYEVEARRGPRATRKTPIEHLVVRVRLAGPNHKTPRASFVSGRQATLGVDASLMLYL